MTRNNFDYSRQDVKALIARLSGMFSVKGGRGWLNWLNKVVWVARGSNTSGIVRSSVVYMRFLQRIRRSRGVTGVVIYTKACYVLTMQSVGGLRIGSTQSLGVAVSRTASGLPRIIPSVHRRQILKGDRLLLKIWLSWFSIYRILEIPGTLKLQSITKPGPLLDSALWAEILAMFPKFLSFWKYGNVGSALKDLHEPRFTTLSKSSPTSAGKAHRASSSPLALYRAAIGIANSNLLTSFEWILSMLPSGDREYPLVKVWRELLSSTRPLKLDQSSKIPLGKLGFKEEAAGKVRVFAMVDCWTQWLLSPIHNHVFSMLERLPSDGTKNQIAPIDRLISLGFTKFWCYDLSAATDRLPVDLQANLLNNLYGNSLGWAWKHLLVGRAYDLPLHPLNEGLKGKIKVSQVHYAVGQPMGALSSWAMLALTHHFIVQWAAFRAGRAFGTFLDYAVLGDDVVIANGEVAGCYLQLMKRLGVEIGLHKSLVSRKGVLEFAKRYLVSGYDCSPIPFKEMAAATVDFENSTEFVRKYNLGITSISAFLGFGYRVRAHLCGLLSQIPKRIQSYAIWKTSPWGATPMATVNDWLKNQYVVPIDMGTPGEMWPSLDVHFGKSFKLLASKDSDRFMRLQSEFPTRHVYTGAERLEKWMEETLYDQAQKLSKLYGLHNYPGKIYNALFYIQSELWKDQIPRLKTDLNSISAAAFAMKTASDNLDESKFLAWYESRKLSGKLVKPALLGETRKAKDHPSVLFGVRLHRHANPRKAKTSK